MENTTDLFKALSDRSRLRILKALQSKRLCACEITRLLNLANSTVSRHLKILKDTGFIVEIKDGKWVNHHINHKPEDPRVATILSSLDFWIADENLIIEDKKVIITLDRNEICKTI